MSSKVSATKFAIPHARVPLVCLRSKLRLDLRGRGHEHPRRMAEDLEFVAPCDTDKRDATGLRRSDRKRSRCRHGDDDAGAHRGGFLHHLDRYPAGEDDGAGAAGCTFDGESAGKLVEGVVAPHVLAHHHGLAAWPEKTRGVSGACLVVEDLWLGEGRDGRADLLRREARRLLDALSDT